MEVNRLLVLVKVGRQIIYMTLLEIVMNLPKKRVAPESELAEEASMTALALTLTVQLLTVLAFTPTSMLPTPVATVVLALLYI